MDIAHLVARLELQSSQFQTELEKTNRKLLGFQKQTNKSLSNIEKGARRFANTLKSAVAGALGAAGFAAIIRSTSEADKAFAQLTAAVASTGGVAGFSAQKLADMSGELQKVSTFGDDAIQSMQAVLLTFTKLRGSEFQGAQQAVLDMSTRLGVDLKSAALQVGKALNDPVKGVSALNRAGVQLSATQTGLVKKLQETGDIAGAQRVILKELEAQFGGSARAARDTLGGALAGLKNAFGDLLEVKTGVPALTDELNKFSDILSDEKTKQSADRLLGIAVSISALGVGTAAAFVEMATNLGLIADPAERVGDIMDELADKRDRLMTFERAGHAEGVASLRNEIAALEIELKHATGAGGPQRRLGPRGDDRGPPDPSAGFVDLSGTDRRLETMRVFQENIADLEFADAMIVSRTEGMRDARDDLMSVLASGIDEGVKESADRAIDSVEQLSDAVGTAIESVQESAVFVEEMQRSLFQNVSGLIGSVGDDMDNFGERMIDTFKKVLADTATQKLFGALFDLGTSLSGSSGASGFWGSVLTGLFGGGKAQGTPLAKGGPLTPGKWHIAGEHGPEPIWGVSAPSSTACRHRD